MYILVQDDDCHWFVIPANEIDHWNYWCEDTADPDATGGWDIPDYAVPVEGSQTRVKFDAFTIDE